MSSLIGHEPCPKCGSRDNLGRYDDGHGFCFGCGYYQPGDGENEPEEQEVEKGTRRLEIVGQFAPLAKRRLHEDTLRHWGYRLDPETGKHYAYYFDTETRKPIAAKVRGAGKDFSFIGSPKEVGLYGQWLWKSPGKMVVITEGELDALSVSQLQSNKWPVVSVPNGAQGAAKAVKKALEWLEGFESVIFMFDMDDPGIAAAKECAQLLSPGKAKIADLPLKDASECLQEGRGDEVVKAIWNARTFRPDGIIAGSEITLDKLKSAQVKGYDIAYPQLNSRIHGLRKREVTLLTAGSGIGKSTLAREIAYCLHRDHGLTIGNVFLEESYEKTAQGYIAIDNDVPLGLLRANPAILSDAIWQDSLARVIHQRMYFYDHFGSLDSDRLLGQLRYMAVSLGCDFIILDHISIVVSGQDSSGEGERKDIDRLMTKLRSLVEETGVGIIAIVHLRQPEGKPHEEGGRVTLSQLRGSGSLKQLSDNVIAMERNQQGKAAHRGIIRILKCREFGEAVGVADTTEYFHETGRLLPVEGDIEFEPVDEGRDF